jgi:hypothetical protein
VAIAVLETLVPDGDGDIDPRVVRAQVALGLAPAKHDLDRARALVFLGLNDEARELLTPLVKAAPPGGRKRAKLLLGFAHYRLGDFERALRTWAETPEEPKPGYLPYPLAKARETCGQAVLGR